MMTWSGTAAVVLIRLLKLGRKCVIVYQSILKMGDADWADDPEAIPSIIKALATYNDGVEALMENAWMKVYGGVSRVLAAPRHQHRDL
jgi:hypothetical protein